MNRFSTMILSLAFCSCCARTIKMKDLRSQVARWLPKGINMIIEAIVEVVNIKDTKVLLSVVIILNQVYQYHSYPAKQHLGAQGGFYLSSLSNFHQSASISASTTCILLPSRSFHMWNIETGLIDAVNKILDFVWCFFQYYFFLEYIFFSHI